MKQKIIGTGLSGMVGSRIVELLADQYQFENLSLEAGVDIRDKKTVRERIKKSGAQTVLHLAAKADVDGCEKDKKEDIKKLTHFYQNATFAGAKLRNLEIESFRKIDFKKIDWSLWQNSNSAWAVNVLGTKNIVDACHAFNKKIIYISTDFVFDGTKPLGDGYTEKDIPCPINWYGQTKYQGERLVYNLKNFLILRIAFPFRAFFPPKRDFVRAILEKLRQGEKIKAVSDQVITPTFIDDIALALRVLIKKEASGVYHLVGSQSLTPYKAVCLISSQFHLNPKLVSCVRMEKYYSEDKAPRPKNLALKNEKIQGLGIKMKTFEEGLREIKNQISKCHPER